MIYFINFLLLIINLVLILVDTAVKGTLITKIKARARFVISVDRVLRNVPLERTKIH